MGTRKRPRCGSLHLSNRGGLLRVGQHHLGTTSRAEIVEAIATQPHAATGARGAGTMGAEVMAATGGVGVGEEAAGIAAAKGDGATGGQQRFRTAGPLSRTLVV